MKLEKKGQELTKLLESNTLSQDELTKTCEAIALIDTQIEQLFLRYEELDQRLKEPL